MDIFVTTKLRIPSNRYGVQLGGDTNLSTPTINTLIVGVLLGGHQTTPILADMVEFNSLQSTYNNLPVTKSN
jgi:hypothetical protein